jgi:hypothetical protein
MRQPIDSMTQEVLNALCRQKFDAFAAKGFSVIEPGKLFQYNWHIGCISEHLQAVYDREITDLIINEPPRTLKSVQVCQLFPPWVMQKEAHHQFIGASYAHSLAERNVMKARQIVQSDWYRQLAPHVLISDDNNKKDFFTTTQNGQYKGTGIGGTITGFGCDTLLVDDPLNPKEAVSDTIRLTAIDEIRSTLFSRFNEYNMRRFIMIMQRLHDADPTGDLMKDGGYYLLKLPAYAPHRIQIDFRGLTWAMEAGEYLTPRLDKAALAKLETDLGSYHFSGQYMQEPVPLGGGDFKEEWIQYYANGSIKPKTMNLVILVDPAGGEEMNKKKRKLSDWSFFDVVGLAPDNNFYWLDGIRDKLNPTERVETLFMLHRKWNDLCGKPAKVGYEKYGMMTDTHYIKERQKQDSYHFPIVELGGPMGKEERIRRLIPDMQNGRWYFPENMIYIDVEGRRFDLVEEFKNEMRTFPRARHDDMLDGKSRIYEPELSMTFPRPKVSMVEKAFRPKREEQGWESY